MPESRRCKQREWAALPRDDRAQVLRISLEFGSAPALLGSRGPVASLPLRRRSSLTIRVEQQGQAI